MRDFTVTPNTFYVAGFTGTQQGMTSSQESTLSLLLPRFHVRVLHLGDCLGADDEAHIIAHRLGLRTIGHPPTIADRRAFCTYAEERPAAPYLERNRVIVDESAVLIAAPKGYVEEQRSGTWYTVRWARASKKPVVVIWPDGKLTDEANAPDKREGFF